MRFALGVAAAVVALSGCDGDLGSTRPNLPAEIGVLTAQAIDSAGATFFVNGLGLNNDGTVAGTMVIGGVTNGFRWKNGVFSMLPPSPGGTQVRGVNNLGDVVGLASNRPVIWYAGAAGPIELFPADTVFISALPFAVNDRREVFLFYDGTRPAVWLGGSFRRIPGYSCIAPVGMNNSGVVAFTTCDGVFSDWVLVPSPWGSQAMSHPTRFANRRDCVRYRGQSAFALNDSNEVLGRTEVESDFTTLDVWIAGGCSNLTSRLPGISIRALNNRGMIGGLRLDGTDTSAVIATDATSAIVDDLMGQPSGQRTWHITDVAKINDAGQILAYGYRYANRRRVPVLLTPPSK